MLYSHLSPAPIGKRARFVAGIVLLLGMVSHSHAAGSLPKLTIPDGFGVNIHFTGAPQDLDLIRDGGFRVIRMDFSWSRIERQKGVYDFEKSGYDALTAGCLQRGIRIIYILDYSNRLYESEQSVRTDAGRKAFAAFAEAAAKHYSGKGILWEFWNEPNIKQFWVPQPDVENYCKLVAEAAPLLRKADPSGVLLAPATSTIPFDWLENCFKQGLLPWIDALSIHPYRPQPPETVVKDYDRLRKLIEQYASQGKKIPIVSGEWGYSNINWDKKRLSDEQQARFLARMFLINLQQKVPVSIWYDWKDDGADPNEREHHFGTVGRDLQPKAAFLAAKSLSATLAGYAMKEQVATLNDNDVVYLLRKGNHSALAVWTVAADHDVTLPFQAGEGTLVDMLGQSKHISWPDHQLKLVLSGSPQYLLIAN
jgi:polysaccharide biosynthesis protein PslG